MIGVVGGNSGSGGFHPFLGSAQSAAANGRRLSEFEVRDIIASASGDPAASAHLLLVYLLRDEERRQQERVNLLQAIARSVATGRVSPGIIAQAYELGLGARVEQLMQLPGRPGTTGIDQALEAATSGGLAYPTDRRPS